MADLDTFVKEIEASKERVVRAVVETHKAIAIKAYAMISADSRETGLRYGSPVWSGRFRASHTIAIGAPDTATKPPNPDTVGAGATRWPDEPDGIYNAPPVSYAAQKLTALKPFQIVYIANALPYARKIELGHSKFKAPEGVYDVTAVAVGAQFRNVTIQRLGL